MAPPPNYFSVDRPLIFSENNDDDHNSNTEGALRSYVDRYVHCQTQQCKEFKNLCPYQGSLLKTNQFIYFMKYPFFYLRKMPSRLLQLLTNHKV